MFLNSIGNLNYCPHKIADMKFNLRHLLLAVFIVAIALGWWTDRRHLQVRLDDQEAKVATLRQQVTRMKIFVDQVGISGIECKHSPSTDLFAPLQVDSRPKHSEQ